ncbi:MAG TPA: carboxylating nicotinate-nucleotide diphosphorylase [Sphingobacteriaceae bacterium]|nr:carboxylating nicotinate-nucleotide diphosphorylase [Sphingobacteriaceae bacterium]
MELNKDLLDSFIKSALAEDVGTGDHTSLATITHGTQGRAQLIIKDDGILAGVEVSKAIFKAVDPALNIEILIEDGTEVHYGDIGLYVEGSVHAILIAERLVLNTMQRMSGIATLTNHIRKKISGTKAQLLDTRKTTPGLRFLEKLAVKIGGGVNHRFGLYDMILIKDNHVDYAGGIAQALDAAMKYLQVNNLSIPVEIEIRNLDELAQVLDYEGIERILLDNFEPDKLKEAVKIINGKFITEASGGISQENVLQYAECGVDYISMGALTHSVKSIDMSLKAIR